MIRFPCSCTNILKLPDEKAGQQVQCPKCGRLLDVPSKDELRNLGSDGTYRLDQLPEHDEAARLAELRRAYGREKLDDEGNEIDLRPSVREVGGTGVDNAQDKKKPAAPRYDPDTGERIVPIDIREDPNEIPRDANIPVARPAPAFVAYGAQASTGASVWKPLIQLLWPGSMVAMVFVGLAHVLGNLIMFAMIATGAASGPLPLIASMPLLGGAMLAHFANVIEEIGPEAADELPRFLRQFNLIDDVWRPLVNLLLAVAYCFGASLLAWQLLASFPGVRFGVAGALAVVGGLFFPAALLTTTTSGTLLNARPDRLWGTIKVMGLRYPYYVLVFFVAIECYATGIWATMDQAENLAAGAKPAFWIENLLPAYSMLALGIYLVHYFLWSLGLAYRRNHEKFPWILQRHIADPAKRMGPRRPHPSLGIAREFAAPLDDEPEENAPMPEPIKVPVLAAPELVVPQRATPQRATPQRGASKRDAPKRDAPQCPIEKRSAAKAGRRWPRRAAPGRWLARRIQDRQFRGGAGAIVGLESAARLGGASAETQSTQG